MAKRPNYQRAPDDFRPGIVAPWPQDKAEPATVAARVKYIPSGEHKTYPSRKRLWTFDHRSHKAKCDHFAGDPWPELKATLQRAIETPVVSAEFRGEFPSRVWAYVNGILHEARLSNQQRGEYHGFPLEYPEQFPIDPHDLLRFAPRVTLAVI